MNRMTYGNKMTPAQQKVFNAWLLTPEGQKWDTKRSFQYGGIIRFDVLEEILKEEGV